MAKQKRDAELTKSKIVKSSLLLFSKKGFDATTVDDIAKDSQVNKAMIYYYFKNKSSLYENLMTNLFQEIHNDMIKSKKDCVDAFDELKMFIEVYAVYCQKYPYLPTLMLRELSNSGKNLPDMMFSGMIDLFSILNETLRKGEKDGVFVDVVPMVIHFMITGTFNLLVVSKPLREKALQLNANLDTCSGCKMQDIAQYIFKKIKLMLEVH